MRKLFTVFVALLIAATLLAQSPEKMSYQAVIRNNGGALVTNTQIGMEINIRQGSPSGSAVYTETQTPVTNANGLVSIEIGGGVGFNTMDWANGPYFIETKTAVLPPLTTYTITGTCQLLSVPYALYAKTAGSTIGESSHYVGEPYGGGVVCWVDHTGQHGLILSMVDLSAGHVWTNVTQVIGSTNDWDGSTNTDSIIAQDGHTSSAAKLCADYVNADYGTGVYNDWYLPSIAELNYVLNNIYEIQKPLYLDGDARTTPLDRMERPLYWSSSAISQLAVVGVDNLGNDVWGTAAWAINFRYFFGDDRINIKGTTFLNKVRAVRKF